MKIRNTKDESYQVVELATENSDKWDEDSIVLYSGSLSDCEAYIRATENNYF